MHVEHELPECAFEPGKALLEHHKARAGKLSRRLEIHLSERFAQFEMLLGREGVIALGAKAMILDIFVRILANRDVIKRQVWDLNK